jgi:single-stranded DNA-binding protein
VSAVTTTICLEHLPKGRLVFVAGKLRMQRWTEKKVRKREQVQVLAEQVIFLDRPELEEESIEEETIAE